MNNQQYIKWAGELCNQEFGGKLKELMEKIKWKMKD